MGTFKEKNERGLAALPFFPNVPLDIPLKFRILSFKLNLKVSNCSHAFSSTSMHIVCFDIVQYPSQPFLKTVAIAIVEIRVTSCRTRSIIEVASSLSCSHSGSSSDPENLKLIPLPVLKMLKISLFDNLDALSVFRFSPTYPSTFPKNSPHTSIRLVFSKTPRIKHSPFSMINPGRRKWTNCMIYMPPRWGCWRHGILRGIIVRPFNYLERNVLPIFRSVLRRGI